MQKGKIPGRQGYDIPICVQYNGENQVVVICHGFGSSKESPMVQALHASMPAVGIGTVSFDFPAHGESPVDGEALRIPNCLQDLAAVEEWVHQLAPHAEVCYFGSSFGAYITLLYLATGQHTGQKAFLRSAAVGMPALVKSWMTQDNLRDLRQKGYFVLEHDYSREMRITPSFLQDLEKNDVFARYRPGMATLYLVHGGADSTASPQDAERFAREKGAQWERIPGAEHRLMGEGEMAHVLACATAFYRGNQLG